MDLRKQALKVLGNKIHHRKKLAEKEEELLNEYVDHAREVFAEMSVYIPKNITDKRTGTELSEYESNRRIYNVIRNKDDKGIEAAVNIMSRGTTRTPFLKQLEELGTQISIKIKRKILSNALDKNQSISRIPKTYRRAGSDIIDPTLPSKNSMWSEIWSDWEYLRGDHRGSYLVAGSDQRLAISEMLRELQGFGYAELAHFYVQYYESGDLFLDLINNYESAGGGRGSLFTKGMVSIRRKITASRGKTVDEIPNFHKNNEGVWDNTVDLYAYEDMLAELDITSGTEYWRR